MEIQWQIKFSKNSFHTICETPNYQVENRTQQSLNDPARLEDALLIFLIFHMSVVLFPPKHLNIPLPSQIFQKINCASSSQATTSKRQEYNPLPGILTF